MKRKIRVIETHLASGTKLKEMGTIFFHKDKEISLRFKKKLADVTVKAHSIMTFVF